jgi:hypothetical protein
MGLQLGHSLQQLGGAGLQLGHPLSQAAATNWAGLGACSGRQLGYQPIPHAQPLGLGLGPPMGQHRAGQLEVQLLQRHGYPIG